MCTLWMGLPVVAGNCVRLHFPAPNGRLYGAKEKNRMTSLTLPSSVSFQSSLQHLFPSFISAGFECSTPINFDRTRIDELAATGHDALVQADYRRLRRFGIR